MMHHALEVREISASDGVAYDAFVSLCPDSLIYGSWAYLDFLHKELSGSSKHILGAYCQGRIVGVLPSFLSPPSDYGRILNSLPFFGSHGGPIIAPEEPAAGVIATFLIQEFFALAVKLNAVAATLVENPYFPLVDHLPSAPQVKISHRISQISSLPDVQVIVDARELLLRSYHLKTRNVVRKGLKNFDRIVVEQSDEALQWLQSEHETAIRNLSGVPKSLGTFKHLRDSFQPSGDFHLVIAYVAEVRVAGLLLLTYGDTVEYFTPVVPALFRDQQVLSAMIFEQMSAFACLGYRRWNWGGTWLNQHGVYRFKSRFGGVDRSYRYYSAVFDKSLFAVPSKDLVSRFPLYFVCPFNVETIEVH